MARRDSTPSGEPPEEAARPSVEDLLDDVLNDPDLDEATEDFCIDLLDAMSATEELTALVKRLPPQDGDVVRRWIRLAMRNDWLSQAACRASVVCDFSSTEPVDVRAWRYPSILPASVWN